MKKNVNEKKGNGKNGMKRKVMGIRLVTEDDLYSRHQYCAQQQHQKRVLAVEGPDVAEAVRLSAVPFAGLVVAQRQR